MTSDPPLISIITVCRNAVETIDATIASTIDQSYPRIDYVVVDGGSTDGTVNKIAHLQAQLSAWISEPDRGIYDAMDKGVRLAKGDWVIFMNAGDRFYSEDSLKELFDLPLGGIDILYANHEVRYASGLSRIQSSREPDELWKGMVCSHQALACRIELLRTHPLSSSSSLAADFDFLIAQQRAGKVLRRRDTITATIAADGVSDSKRLSVYRSYFGTIRKMESGPRVYAYYAWMLARSAVALTAKRFLSGRTWERLARFRHGGTVRR